MADFTITETTQHLVTGVESADEALELWLATAPNESEKISFIGVLERAVTGHDGPDG